MRPDQRHWIENPPHRPLAQAGIAVEGRGDGTACDRPHDQAAAGAGIAEVEGAIGLAQAADADAVNAPSAFAGALDRGAQRPHGLCGVDDVLALEQPGDARLADRERAEDQGAVRDRFVTGHAHAALEGARTARGERGWGGMVHGANLGWMEGSLAWARGSVIRPGRRQNSARAAAKTGAPNAIAT